MTYPAVWKILVDTGGRGKKDGFLDTERQVGGDWATLSPNYLQIIRLEINLAFMVGNQACLFITVSLALHISGENLCCEAEKQEPLEGW